MFGGSGSGQVMGGRASDVVAAAAGPLSSKGQIRFSAPLRRSALSVSVCAAALVVGLVAVVGHVVVGPPAPGVRSPVAVGNRAAAQDGLLALPVAAQGPVSGALGADRAAYAVTSSAGGLHATSPAQRLEERFTRSGVLVSSARTSLGLSLSGVDFGGSLRSVVAVAPAAKGNRVTYRHAGVSEWLANGPGGVEQGFTVSRPRAGAVAGTLTLEMTLAGNARASLENGGQSVTFSHAGRTLAQLHGPGRLRRGRQAARSWMQLHGDRLLLRVGLQGARFPLHIDPLIRGTELTGTETNYFGYSVALSANGDTALVGAPTQAPGGEEGKPTTAWVFIRQGTTWTLQQKLTGAGQGGPRPGFGDAVALSADGNTALISGYFNDEGVGAVWFFTRSGSTWTEQQKFTGAGESGTYPDFGFSLALSPEGNTALVTSPFDGETGAAWVFTREGSSWTEQQKFTATGAHGKVGFGWSAALGNDGNTALIGGNYDEEHVGAAWVFTREGSSWSEQQTLIGADDGRHGVFGRGVALSENGKVALVGGSEGGGGYVSVFGEEGSSWTEQQTLTAGRKRGVTNFGGHLALSADGSTALVGGEFYEEGKGAAWVFTHTGTTWKQTRKLTAEVPLRGYFGDGVALSENGKTGLVGAPGDEGGAAWAFTAHR